MKTNRFLFVAICALLFIAISGLASAEDYSSPSFIIRAPVVTVGGSNSTSTSFQMQGALGQIISGINIGLTFQQAAGFFYFGITATSTSSSPPSTPASTPSGGGGGAAIVTAVNFSGRAYPLSVVEILKDGQVAVSTIAGPDAKFSVSLSGLSSGSYIFSVIGEDSQKNKSTLFTFPISVTYGATVNVSGIFLAPTISVDKSEVAKGDNIVIFGQSVPQSEITIGVASEEEQFVKTPTDENGVYLYNFNTSDIEKGQHFTRSKAALAGEVSSFSKTVGFSVGTKNVLAEAKKAVRKGDLNADGRVNLIDFSIAAFWHKRPLDESFQKIEAERLNNDGKVNLIDFSIMAYYWTG